MSEEGGLEEVEESLRAAASLLQTGHGSLQPLELLLQPLASGTGVRCYFGHATVLFSACLSGEQWA